ncbi:alpha/beta fold hydrolase [Nocardia sp. NBC_01329]|uniref:alpha/beta fold hydrolase n=1 Tax=Nocardia sp. NBC_01329 TaxID=2903594 RepID=UPI002E111800|nr:alpha/beta hydrolase [Nocardia sp. NBC_01329]
MLVKSITALSQAHQGALTAPYRATLRARRFRTSHYNAPIAVPEVIPVTTADGARLRVHSYGPADAEPIVLIHGWSCCIEYWHPQINAFADRYRVIAYDQRGHGDSTLGRTPLGDRTLADDLATVLEATLRPDEQALLVGHSMGGITLQAWAARHPQQVARRARAVVLANTTSGNIRYDTDLLPLLNKPLSVGNLPLTLLGSPIRLPMIVAESILTTPLPLPGGWAVREILKQRIMARGATNEQADFALNIVRSCRPLARGRHAAILADLQLGAAAANLTVPTTIIAGRYDRLLPERMSRLIADTMEAAGHRPDYQVWPTGHLGNIERIDHFNTELTAILNRTSSRSAAAG